MIFSSECFLKLHGWVALSILFSSIMTTTGCQSREASPASPPPDVPVDTLPVDFVIFYRLFHDDSAYQMDHIIFPLEGMPNSLGDDDTLTTTRYFWQKKDWKKHNRFVDPGGDFDQWFEVFDDRFIEHWVNMKGTNMYMRRRFAKMDDEWFLIYYQGMQPLNLKGGQ